MASDQDANLSQTPSEQLDRIQSWCRDSAPAFYADQERYLSVLRHHLSEAAHRALAQLLCQVDQARLDQLSNQERDSLQDNIDQLLLRCSSLLTIEQLQLLSRRLERQKQVRRRQAQQAMVEALQRSSETRPDDQDSDTPAVDPEAVDPIAGGVSAGGSVELSFAPPIDQPSLLDGLLPVSDLMAEDAAPDAEESDQFDPDLPFEQPPEMEPATSDLAMLRSLFVMAGDAMEASTLSDPADSDQPDDLVAAVAPEGSKESAFMPSMPLELLRWLDGLDAAIHRRLRNLSHAINVELLRSGVASSLLPMSLLDAVLNGQVETLPTASNLLRLRVPMPMTTPGDPSMDLSCLFLRSSELEFDLVPLRRCRSRLRQRRDILLTMVRQQRHWQRRAQTQQVQQQWWPSPPTSPSQS